MIKNLKKAFTIIELVIVIAVIAILAAVMIPTYSSLVEKANLSADEQAVQQMNKALKIYEAENGKKPKDKIEAKKALDENLINTESMVPVTQGYAFYWDEGENKVILVSNNDTVKSDWHLLTSTGYGTLNKVTTSEAITTAISSSTKEKPVLIKLENSIEIASDIVATKTTGYVKKDGSADNFDVVYSIVKENSVILDLNGKTLTDESSYCTFAVCPGGTLTIKNGTIECTSNPRAINSFAGTITLDNVTIKTSIDNFSGNKYALKIEGIADSSIVNSTIINDYGFALTSNSELPISDGARFSIVNSTLVSKHDNCAGVFLGTYCDLTIDNCEISGGAHGLFLRGCNATIEDSKIYNTRKDGDIEGNKGWDNGNNGRCADIVFASGGTEYGDGYIKTGNYACENVTGKDGSLDNFVVFKHQPEGGTVNVSGINVDYTFTNKRVYKTDTVVDGKTIEDSESGYIEEWNQTY